MSVNQAGMTTHVPQSLPSFAQAFSNNSLGNIPSGNTALPPIQGHMSLPDRDRGRLPSSPPASEDSAPRTQGRKRPHTDSRDDHNSDSDRASPALIRVKEEVDQEMLGPSPSPPARSSDQRPQQDTNHLGAPTPSSTMPSPVKKRRMTITGGLNTDVRVPQDQGNVTPISPVVMGFTIPRDNPKEVEQVKSMMSVKQKQKALIEQRRGSVVAPGGPNPAPSQSANDERSSGSSKPSAPPPIPVRNARRSPNGGAATRRSGPVPQQQGGGLHRPNSPNPSSVFQMQQSQAVPHQSAHTLPPPPISFARRRAAQLGTKRKPADIVISPRDHQSTERFQPSIHSAPPTQGAFYSGKHTMALPRLPNIMATGGGEPVRRPMGNVPPTPTRFSQRMAPSAIPPSITISESTPRSPRNTASVPIASSLVPPTPAFNQTDFSGDRAAFLAPFGYFYDALNDAKQLKTYLGDQLQRSNALYQNLSQHQDRMNDMVERLVEKKMAAMGAEVDTLRRRVLHLEEALRESRSAHLPNHDPPSGYHSKTLQNGYPSSSGHLAPEYTFPPPQDHSRLRTDLSSGRVSSPRGHDLRSGVPQQQLHSEREREREREPEYEPPSISYDSRRSSVSASRLDPPNRGAHGAEPSPLPPLATPSHSRISMIMQSPPQAYRESPMMPPRQGGGREHDSFQQRGPQTRHASYNGSSQHDRDREREREREWEMDRDRERGRGDSPPPLGRPRLESRRNSVIMSPPDQRMDEA